MAKVVFMLVQLKIKILNLVLASALVFSISQHVRDELLFTKFIEYLGCGTTVYKFSTRPDSVSFTVSQFKYISEKQGEKKTFFPKVSFTRYQSFRFPMFLLSI